MRSKSSSICDVARRFLVAAVLCGAASLACPSPSHAQVPPPAKDPTGSWFQVTPYLWMASIKGENTIGDETIPIDVNFGDIWSALKFAFSFHFEGGEEPRARRRGLRLHPAGRGRHRGRDARSGAAHRRLPVHDHSDRAVRSLSGQSDGEDEVRSARRDQDQQPESGLYDHVGARTGRLMSARPGRISSRASASSPT